MSVGVAVMLLVLVVLVALAFASLFRHMLTALTVLVAIPVGLVLHALLGTGYTVFAIALLAVFGAVIHTITDTLSLLRGANRTDPKVRRSRERRNVRLWTEGDLAPARNRPPLVLHPARSRGAPRRRAPERPGRSR